MSEKLYLENIANKVVMYAEAKEQAVQWLIEKQIKDKEKIQNALIMSQIWLAHNLNEKITMADLMVLLLKLKMCLTIKVILMIKTIATLNWIMIW